MARIRLDGIYSALQGAGLTGTKQIGRYDQTAGYTLRVSPMDCATAWVGYYMPRDGFNSPDVADAVYSGIMQLVTDALIRAGYSIDKDAAGLDGVLAVKAPAPWGCW